MGIAIFRKRREKQVVKPKEDKKKSPKKAKK